MQSIRVDKDTEGRDITRTNSYVELADGLNYWSQEGQEWRVSNPEFKALPGGFAATEVPTQLIIAPDISTDGAVDMLTSDGKRFRSNPAFLAFRDVSTGQSAIIAEIKTCPATLLEKNVVVFADVLSSGNKAALRYTIWPSGAVEQDLIFLENSEKLDPRFYGLNEKTSHLELWSEFLEWSEPDSIVALPDGLPIPRHGEHERQYFLRAPEDDDLPSAPAHKPYSNRHGPGAPGSTRDFVFVVWLSLFSPRLLREWGKSERDADSHKWSRGWGVWRFRSHLERGIKVSQ